MALTEMKGLPGSRRATRDHLGLGRFHRIQMAPAMGLPPVLPGTISAEVEGASGVVGTIIASSIGLWMIAFARGRCLGEVALLAAPRFISAPQLELPYWRSPTELSQIRVL
jgi:predicted cobalt transporter CbtA